MNKTTDPRSAQDLQSTSAAPVVPGARFRRNVVAVGAALGLTLAGLGFAGAAPETASEESGNSSQSAPAARGEGRPGADGRADGQDGRHGPRRMMLETAAKTIGITAEELRTELRAGKSIASVAREHSVDPQTVVDALVAEAQSHLEERMTKLVNRTPGEGRSDRSADDEGAEPAAA